MLMSLSGVLLIATAPEPAEAQGRCANVCSGDDFGACLWCERWEHYGWGTMAAGSALTIGGLAGAITLGQLCRGLESGGVGVAGDVGVSGEGGPPGDGGTPTEPEEERDVPRGRPTGGYYPEGEGGDEGASRPGVAEGESRGPSEAGADGPRRIGPVTGEPRAPAEAEGEARSTAAEPEAFRPAAPEGAAPPTGPMSDAARDRWNLLNVDGEGRIYGPGHQHMLNIDGDGNITDLSGRPVQQVTQDDISTRIQTYVDADGNEIRIDADGQAWRTTAIGGEERFDLPTSPQPRPNLSPDVALRWDLAGAGPNGELYAPDGRIIGRIDADGNMFTTDGVRVTGHDTPDGGRLQSFTTEDGHKWTWTDTGEFRPSRLPDGEPFRPMSSEEWRRLDAQRAPTQVEGEGGRISGPVGDGTLIEGGGGARHVAPPGSGDLSETGMAGGRTRVEGQDFDTRFPPGADTRVEFEGSEGRPTGPGGETQMHGGETRVEGAGETRVPAGAETRVEGGEARGAGTETGAEGGEARAAGTGADAEGGGARAAGTGAEGEGGAVRPAGAGAEGEGGAPRPAGADADSGSLVSSGFSRVMDAQNVQQLYNQHVAEGKSPEEAFALAVAQTGAGNLAGGTNPFGGITDPRLSAAAGALLPGGMANIIPDRAVENFVGTGYDALEAVSESLGASAASGELDTTALDNFAERVANRPNADPFAGYAQAAQLLGEETARTDGGNLISDLQQIYETGAGTEVLNESMSGFQQQVEQGQFGAPLQGLNDLASAASEVIVDPTTTVGQFVDDVRNIYNHGVGDGFWDEALNHTANVIKNTPVAGTIYDGYHQVFSGVAEQGVTGFASEMAEGAYALGQEAYDAAANSLADAANSTYNYIRSWF